MARLVVQFIRLRSAVRSAVGLGAVLSGPDSGPGLLSGIVDRGHARIAMRGAVVVAGIYARIMGGSWCR